MRRGTSERSEPATKTRILSGRRGSHLGCPVEGEKGASRSERLLDRTRSALGARPGPARRTGGGPSLFAETPNYRGLGKAVIGREEFRWHFGPMFYRGRLTDGGVKVLVIGQEGAQDESLGHRSFVGGTGARMQHVLHHLGITRSYLFLNTFVYPIFGQYNGDAARRWPRTRDSPIVQAPPRASSTRCWPRNDLRLVIAVGTAAKESVVTWVTSRGGACPAGPPDVSRFTPAGVLGPRTKAVGVLHPGGAAARRSTSAIIADFKRALGADRASGPADDPGVAAAPIPAATRQPAGAYKYKSDPIPFRDLPFGTCWRLGRGGTSSNRKDDQRAIQIFSDGGALQRPRAHRPTRRRRRARNEGYDDDAGDLPYEPPRAAARRLRPGPVGRAGAAAAGRPSPASRGPTSPPSACRAHPSFGTARSTAAGSAGVSVLVLADQESHDDLFTGTGA